MFHTQPGLEQNWRGGGGKKIPFQGSKRVPHDQLSSLSKISYIRGI